MSEATAADRARWVLVEALKDLPLANLLLQQLAERGLHIVATPPGGVPVEPEMWSVEQIHVLHELREYLELPIPSTPERVIELAMDELAARDAERAEQSRGER